MFDLYQGQDFTVNTRRNDSLNNLPGEGKYFSVSVQPSAFEYSINNVFLFVGETNVVNYVLSGNNYTGKFTSKGAFKTITSSNHISGNIGSTLYNPNEDALVVTGVNSDIILGFSVFVI